MNLAQELEELKGAAERWTMDRSSLMERQLCEAAVAFTKALELARKAKEESILNRWKREER